MKIAEVLFITILLFIILVLVYGTVKSPPKQKNIQDIQNNTPKSIIKDEPSKKKKHVTFPPDLRKSELSSLKYVPKNQKPTKELDDMYEEARETVPTDEPFKECNGRLQNPPLRFNV
jgi:regulatory protein YycI of two-component signal transduction system YycFG